MKEERDENIKISSDIERYTAILNKDPKARVYAPLAEAYRKSGNIDKAIEVSKKGLSLYPDYLSCRVTLGRAYYDKGMYEEAKSELLKVVEVIPDNLMAQRLLGNIYKMEGDIENAIKSYEMVILQNPGDKEIAEEIEALKREKFKEPERKREKREINTETLAEIYIKQGYLKRAFDIYKELYLSDPQNKAIKSKLLELKRMILEKEGKKGSSNKGKIKVLEGWLDNIQKMRGR